MPGPPALPSARTRSRIRIRLAWSTPPMKRYQIPLRRLAFVALTWSVLVAEPRAQPPVEANAQPPVAARFTLTAVDAAGNAAPALEASELEARVDGQPVALSHLEPAGPRPVVVYLDRVLASPGTLQRAASLLGSHAGRLVALGPVEVVAAEPVPRLVQAASQEPAGLEAVLAQLALGGQGDETLLAVRQRFLRRVEGLRGRTGMADGQGALVELIDEAIAAETVVVTRQLDFLLSHLGTRPGGGVLVWVADGFELAPQEPYLARLPASVAEPTRTLLRPPAVASLGEETARAVAALGWTVLALAPGEAEAGVSAQRLETDRLRESASGRDPGASQPFLSTTLEGIRRRLKEGEAGEVVEGSLAFAPQAALAQLTAASGGVLVASAADLPAALERLGGARVAHLELASEGVQSLRLRPSRRGLDLAAPQWLATTLPEALAAARVRRLLAGEPGGGSLDVVATLQSAAEPGAAATLEARAELAELLAPDAELGEVAAPRRLRVTLAPGGSAGPDRLEHVYEVLAEPGAPWVHHGAVDLPEQSDRFAVVIEDLATGAWGGTLAALLGDVVAQGESAPAADAPGPAALAEAAFLPLAQPIRFARPDRPVLQGKVLFRVEPVLAQVARVDFFLDGEVVASAERRPFEARVQLGRLPRPRTLRAVAFDAAGRRLGSDVLLLNEAGGDFRIRITEPQPGRQFGAIEVSVSAQVPNDRRIERVELSWNQRRVATLYAPPYRQRFVVPTNDPSGFIRALAFLDDGRTAEDVVFLNEQDFADRVQVRLVELYTVVTDRQGRPVRGLPRERFTVKEEGSVQEIVDFSDAGDLPVTLGLNIDSSASMFVKLPVVKDAAIAFVRGFLSGRDRALLVDFDTAPRIARELTSNLDAVVEAVERLDAGGDTHIWESIVYTLIELQGVTGKKALVVFSDGAHEEEPLTYKLCFDFAQRLGVPIYLVVLHPGIARGDDLSTGTKTFTRQLERLAEATGGRVFFLPNTQGLDTIYRQIDEELRSQYLLAYYARSTADNAEPWRKVAVEVEGKDLAARTISGYFTTW